MIDQQNQLLLIPHCKIIKFKIYKIESVSDIQDRH